VAEGVQVEAGEWLSPGIRWVDPVEVLVKVLDPSVVVGDDEKGVNGVNNKGTVTFLNALQSTLIDYPTKNRYLL